MYVSFQSPHAVVGSSTQRNFVLADSILIFLEDAMHMTFAQTGMRDHVRKVALFSLGAAGADQLFGAIAVLHLQFQIRPMALEDAFGAGIAGILKALDRVVVLLIGE